MMKITKDDELNGFAQVYENIDELIDTAEKSDPEAYCPKGYSSWGESFSSWKAVRDMWTNTWSEGHQRMQAIATEIAKSIPVPPVSIRRQRRWSENDGEVDVDRALAGEDNYLRESFRTKRPRVQNVTLLQNIGATHEVTSEDLAWRSASCIIALDLLEEAGYSSEFWIYSNGLDRHYDPRYPHNFSAVCIKQAGDAVDIDTLIKATSPWFFRTVFFASWNAASPVQSDKGRSREINKERWFNRHCSPDVHNEQIWMPFTMNKIDAVRQVKSIIETIEQPV